MQHDFINSEIANNAIGILLLRTVAGILFFFQGYDKLFNIKISNVVRAFNEPLSKIRIPPPLVKPFITISSLVEFICGMLLIIGLFRSIALYFLAVDMIFIAFIFSSVKAMWDMQYYFPRLLCIVILLFCPMNCDVFSLDSLLHLF